MLLQLNGLDEMIMDADENAHIYKKKELKLGMICTLRGKNSTKET